MPDWPLINSALEIAAADDGAVVEDAARGRFHYINHTGAFVLSLCDGQTSIDSMAEHMRDQFCLSQAPGALVTDILRQFVTEGLVTAGPGPQ